MVAHNPGLGRQLRAIGPLPVMATVVVPLGIVLVAGAEPGWGLSGGLAAGAIVAGLVLALWGLRLMSETISLFSTVGEGTLAPWDPTRRLVVRGPYLRVRNPMITGVFLVLTGETLILGAPQMAAWTAIFAAANAFWMPLVEEPGLVRRFGDDYVTYRDNVPRWIPRRRPWVPTFALALALALAAAGPAAADAPGVATQAIEQSPAEVRDYWTPERMREAVPLDLPAGPAAAAGGSSFTPYANPPDEETDPALDTSYPQRIHGIVFLRFGISDASCSGTVVTARSKNVILTAGHCVAIPGEEAGGAPVFATNVLFVPGYRNGARPLGTYAATTARAPFAWTTSGDLSVDIGAYNLAPLSGVEIENALGSRGLSFNRPLTSYKKNKTRFQLFGYPAQPSAFYDGERLIHCNSLFAGFQVIFLSPVVPCNMQQGSSGGAFVLKGGLVNSVISHNACGTDPACRFIAGTYFGDAAYSVWSKAAGGVSKGTKKKIKGCKRKPKGSKRDNCMMKAKTFKPHPV